MSLIDALTTLIHSALNKKLLIDVYREAKYTDRVYGYQDLVMDVCSRIFRMHNDSVCWHDGRVWCPLDDFVLETSLTRALVKGGVPKGDIVNYRMKLLHYARGGAGMSRLELSPCVVGFSNGVWDFSDIESPVYHPFSDRMPVVAVLPYDYDPSAVCPRWLSFLHSILPNGEIMKLQKYLGLGCADRRRMTHKVEETLWLVGSGANGKSTIFDVVRGVYGAGNISYVGLDTLLGGSAEVRARFIGSIAGKLFNYCSEIQADDMSRYADTFKSLCSGEPQTVRRLGHNPETVFDIPFLVFNMNQKPHNRRMDQAMARRLLFVPFRTTVSAADMDRELSSELMKELPGIRNWMMEGYRMLVRDGYRFDMTQAGDDEMTDYMLENGQSVQVFLQKRGYSCNRRTGHWEDRAQWVLASALYEDYVSFCSQWLQEPLTLRAFGGEMSRLGWHEAGGGKKRTSVGYAYAIYCEEAIGYAERRI